MSKRFLALVLSLCLSLSLFGCSNSQNGNIAEQNPTVQKSQDSSSLMSDMPQNNSESEAAQNMSADTYSQSRSQAISTAITAEIAQANEVWCMVVGDMAYIALDLPAQDGADTAQDVKEQAAMVAKKTDEKITDVFVVADADSFSRIKDSVKDMTDGEPVRGLTAEIKTLFTRITPTMSK